jgi:nitrate/nitrite transporter NarK
MNSIAHPPKSYSRWLRMFILVFAGELIFSLPFHVIRVFRPTLLEVFQLTNTEIGDSMAFYGVMAMLTYFPGGTLADRFSARKLMSISLLATGLGGFYFAQIPGHMGLTFLFGWWGITTIFLFWAAMIKATRDWGGKLSQGKAFGILDGGRGLIAAGAATLAVFILSSFLPVRVEDASFEDKQQALKMVIYFYTFLTILASVLVWFFISDTNDKQSRNDKNLWTHIKAVLTQKVVWMQAIVVVCAYSAYKGLEYYTLYATDVLGINEVDAAFFMSNALYIRAGAAVAAGFIVDKLSASKVISWLFGIMLICYLILSVITPIPNFILVIYTDIIITFVAVYALRGVYFALLEETKVSSALTGTAVGLISVIGYTPDVFFNSVAGRIIDATPGLGGHQHFYLMLGGFSFLGLLTVSVLSKQVAKVKNEYT